MYQIIYKEEKYIFQKLMTFRDLKLLISVITIFLKRQIFQIIYLWYIHKMWHVSLGSKVQWRQ